MDIFRLISHPLKVATLSEIQTIYNTQDVYDLLEYLDVHDEFEFVHKQMQGNN